MNTENLQPNEEYGFVYVLKNECMPGLLKIGITDNMPERLRTLNNTSVPVQFEQFWLPLHPISSFTDTI